MAKDAGANKNIILISLYHYGAFGARILQDVLKASGYNAHNIYFKRDKTNEMTLPSSAEIKLLIDQIGKINPILIGVSVRSAFYPVAKMITESIRSNFEIPVIWGGSHPTICPEESIKIADMICVGEGERLIVELADNLSSKKDHSAVKGLWFKKEDKIFKNDIDSLIENLDTIPLPGFDDTNTMAIEDNNISHGDPYYNAELLNYNFMTARGCPFQCTFCSNSILKDIFKGKGKYVRQRSAENVVDELKIAKAAFPKLRQISCNDEVFSIDIEWLKTFSRLYIKEINLPFHCDIHPSFVSEDRIRILKDTGLRTLSMGIQSGSNKIRNEIFERNTPDDVLKNAAKIFKKYKIFPSYDIIFDNPLESLDDLKNTLDFMLELPRPYRLNMYSMQYHPKTKLTEMLLKRKIISENDVDGVSLKGLTQWHVNYDRKNQNKDFIHLYKMFLLLATYVNTSSNDPSKVLILFPKMLIKILCKSNLIKKYQVLSSWIQYLPKITFGMSLFFKGDFKYILKHVKRLLRIH